MALVIGDPGVLRDAIAAGLESRGRDVVVAPPEDEDLWTKAKGRGAVVYVPVPSLRDGALDPRPRPERMKEAIAAAHAPGVEVLVAVLPTGDGYQAELTELRRDGVPYVVLKAPMSFEELGQTLEGRRVLFVSSDSEVRVIDTGDLAGVVDAAIDTEDQGRVNELATAPLRAELALRRAAATTARRVWIFALWAPLYRFVRWVGRVLHRPVAPALVACERLALPPGSEPHEAH